MSQKDGVGDSDNDNNQESKSRALVESILSVHDGFSEGALSSAILKDKHYSTLSKLLTPLGMELTGLMDV